MGANLVAGSSDMQTSTKHCHEASRSRADRNKESRRPPVSSDEVADPAAVAVVDQRAVGPAAAAAEAADSKAGLAEDIQQEGMTA